MPLSNLSKQLPDELFVRIHRSYVVNLTRVDEVAENHIVVSERAIPIGKSYRDTFLQRLQLIR
jgi:DNA-binding LytR/AlgR family response regulator